MFKKMVGFVKSKWTAVSAVGLVAVSQAHATIPAELESLKTDAAASVTWVQGFVLSMLVFSFIVGIILRGRRKTG